MRFPTHSTGSPYGRLVSRTYSPHTPTIPDPELGSSLSLACDKVRPRAELCKIHVNPDYTQSYWLGTLYSALHPPLHRLGSHANLDPTRMPEGVDGFRIVREWVRFACDGLKYSSKPPELVYNEHFGPQFMVACTLAFDLDRENARYLVPGTRMHRWSIWPRCLVREGGFFVVRDFVAFARGEVDGALALGYFFLRYEWRHAQVHLASN